MEIVLRRSGNLLGSTMNFLLKPGFENEFLWVEKYRPWYVADCVLPPELKSTFFDIIEGMSIGGTPC